MGEVGAARIRTRLGAACGMPSRAAQTLPTFWHKGELEAVPHLSPVEPELAGPVVDGEAVCRVEALPVCIGRAMNGTAREPG